MSGFWDGNAPDWGTALGTLGLALITTVAVLREAKDRKELRAERDAAREETRKLEQQNAARAEAEAAALERRELRIYADAVTCYMDNVAYDPDTVVIAPGDGLPPRQGTVLRCAVIRNLSTAPVRNVEIFWQSARLGREPEGDVSIVPPVLLDVVPPAGLRAMRQPTAIDGSWTPGMLALLIKFEDIKGNHWGRRHNGRLYSMGPDGGLIPVEPTA